MENRVLDHIHQSIDTLMQAEQLVPGLCDASALMVNCLVNERKILTAGNGISNGVAQILSTVLLNRLTHERPGLPALHLGSDSLVLTAIANDQNLTEIFAKQIRALGQPGDVFVVYSDQGNESNLIQAIAAAHDRDISVVALSGNDGGNLAAMLTSDDIGLCLEHQNLQQIHQLQLTLTFGLCDLIDFQLFGG